MPRSRQLDPGVVYRDRLAEREWLAAAAAASSRRLSWLRLAVIAVSVGLGLAASETDLLHPLWLLLPAAVFLGLVLRHDAVIRSETRHRRAAEFYRQGLDRLHNRWQGSGPGGTGRASPEHPFAADLDVLGDSSLFQLLCRARTETGEEILAAWLLQPASAVEVRARQEAVDELRPRLDSREHMALLGGAGRGTLMSTRLAAWSGAPAQRLPGWWSAAAVAMTAISAVALLGWMSSVWSASVVLGTFLFHMSLRWKMRTFVDHTLAAMDRPAADLGGLAAVLQRVESEEVSSQRLVEIREALSRAGRTASRRIYALGVLAERLEYRRNLIFAPLDFLLFWSFHHARAVERWRLENGGQVEDWLRAGGEFEALLSLAGHAFEHPADVFPKIEDGVATLVAEGLAHPLLPESRAVRNDVRLAGSRRVLVVSGSNMSGKSTLLRAVGLNVVLALAGAPVRSRSMSLAPLAVGASIRIVDSLSAGRSRFLAEVLRLKQIVDLADAGSGVLFLLDEIFHGTNSHDRRVGAEMVVRHLVDAGAIGLVTTHDLELARLAETLAPRVANVHFEDAVVDGELRFDFRLRPGTVQRSNAVALMRSVGLPVS